MKNVIIVDYGLGNLYSIVQACSYLGHSAEISRDSKKIIAADYLILPGVGAFGIAMQYLENAQLIQPINEYVSSEKPLMGICLGMQLLFDKSEEFGEHKGLGFISGSVTRFPSNVNGKQLKVPNIGWSKIYAPKSVSWDKTPLADIDPNEDHMYFVHSYFVKPKDSTSALSLTNYNDFEYVSSVRNRNIWGFQFHPEKSGEAGLTIYNNFFRI
jgi:glutamine amidotransferase